MQATTTRQVLASMATFNIMLFGLLVASAVTFANAQSPDPACQGCLAPTISCPLASQIGPSTYYITCIPGAAVNLLQATGCVASYSFSKGWTPVSDIIGRRRLASIAQTTPIRHLLDTIPSGGPAPPQCAAAIGNDAGVICSQSHLGLSTGQVCFAQQGVNVRPDTLPTGTCDPTCVNITLAGSCEVGGKSARSTITKCTTNITSVTQTRTGALVSADDFGCTSTNSYAAALNFDPAAWYFFRGYNPGDAKSYRFVPYTPLFATRQCQYEIGVFAGNACRTIANFTTVTIGTPGTPVIKARGNPSCPYPTGVVSFA